MGVCLADRDRHVQRQQRRQSVAAGGSTWRSVHETEGEAEGGGYEHDQGHEHENDHEDHGHEDHEDHDYPDHEQYHYEEY